MKPNLRQVKDEFKRNDPVCNRVVTLFQLMANKIRFRIICALAHGEFSVHEIVELVGEGRVSNVSQQLKLLTLAGVAQRRREDRHVLYSLKDQRVLDLIGYLKRSFLDAEL